jgi:hypothetical protein
MRLLSVGWIVRHGVGVSVAFRAVGGRVGVCAAEHPAATTTAIRVHTMAARLLETRPSSIAASAVSRE